MEKRVLIAVVLSFLVLYLYQSFFSPAPQRKPAVQTQTSAKGPETPVPDASRAVASTPTGVAAGTPAVAAVPAPAAVVGDTIERDIVVETKAVRAVFSNRGAHIKSWRLKRYLDDQKRPVELVPVKIAAGAPHPFMLKLEDSSRTAEVNAALFRLDGEGRQEIDGTTAPVHLAFEFRDVAGLSVRKTFDLAPDSYVIKFGAEVLVGSQPMNVAVMWGRGLGDIENSASNKYLQKPQGILMQDGKVERMDGSAITKQPAREGVMRFAGIDDHYFLAAALLGPTNTRIDYETETVPDPLVKEGHQFAAFTVNPTGPSVDTKFFFGPKNFDLLRDVDQELVRVINFGIFAFLAVPLLRALNGVNAYLGNFGWSIIALTVFINALIFPLRHKSVVSMRKLQELQPEIKAIQDRYGKLKATDPAKQKMNQEMMSLYKERGVNPASGCVPTLLTIPVLFAFYSLLSQAIELRGAPFALWIKDLSVYDPLYVTPVLMGITMFVQQKMTPSTMDPAQQKMMMMMPAVFLFMFLWAPSGLVIYWFVSNVLAIAQQYFTNRIIGPAKVVPRAAAGRVKAVGSGKSGGAA
jgi:YidC/Oxa1 family membrane protein insertase